jgi:hypothetical protein
MIDDRTAAERQAYDDVNAVLSREPAPLVSTSERPRASISPVEVDAPAAWCGALIYDDWSGMTDDEEAECRRWLAALEHHGKRAHVCDMGEEWFGVYRPFMGSPMGCDLATYTVLVEA